MVSGSIIILLPTFVIVISIRERSGKGGKKAKKFINKTNLTILTMKIEITKITSKGQVVIPKEIRKELGITSGERFIVYDTKDSVVLKRIKNLEEVKDPEEFEKTFSKTWKIAKEKRITRKDVEREIEAFRKEK